MRPGAFVSMSIFKTGLLLLLKNYFDQQSDKGKKQAANYLNPPNTLEFQHGEQTTACELMWIGFKKIKNASGLVSFIPAARSQHVESVD